MTEDKPIREQQVESYFTTQITKAGGVTKKLKNLNDPDRLVVWPPKPPQDMDARIHFVEVKRPGGKPRPGQAREHVRLMKLGCRVFIIDTFAKVDKYVSMYRLPTQGEKQ